MRYRVKEWSRKDIWGPIYRFRAALGGGRPRRSRVWEAANWAAHLSAGTGRRTRRLLVLCRAREAARAAREGPHREGNAAGRGGVDARDRAELEVTHDHRCDNTMREYVEYLKLAAESFERRRQRGPEAFRG